MMARPVPVVKGKEKFIDHRPVPKLADIRMELKGRFSVFGSLVDIGIPHPLSELAKVRLHVRGRGRWAEWTPVGPKIKHGERVIISGSLSGQPKAIEVNHSSIKPAIELDMNDLVASLTDHSGVDWRP